MDAWDISIDVGGTFTDAVARAPDGRESTTKLLSSGVTRGRADAVGDGWIEDAARRGDPEGFWVGQRVRVGGAEAPVAEFHRSIGRLTLAHPVELAQGANYELVGGEDAPLAAIRWLLGLPAGAPLPPARVRLGTTRGTNALLTRRGARTALVTTRGFADVLVIGTQDRPRLFDLAIDKPRPLYERVVEIDERVAADGGVLQAPDPAAVRAALSPLLQAGVTSLAVCLLHGFAYPAHEELVAEAARGLGFAHVTTSRSAPLERLVYRADTLVLDAYLTPILADYLGGLERALGPRSSLHLMTSAGGLVRARTFSGKDSVLSGPAGGAVGCAAAARRAGFARAIGLDMGGTSTDVSRWDGRHELQHGARKAGVRLVAPTLAIETVAAGGGSICAFDGVKLVVGPDSAGADPGPACYGRGGPLTITDCNLVLGRVLAERFPFPLDVEAARARLVAIAATVPQSYGVEELAAGFVAVADAAMARAVRAVTVARGVNPSDHVLVCFGGAAAQHACALARDLRMKSVLLHPHAAVLSAWGISLADVRRVRERAVLAPLEEAPVAALHAELEAAARAEVEADGVPRERVEITRWLELRYRGVEATIDVPEEEGGWARAYQRRHQQLYGYTHEGRALEVVAARVEATGQLVGGVEAPPAQAPERRARPRRRTTVWLDGAREVDVYLREDLAPGDVLDGPALVGEVGSTVVLDVGWSARVTAHGDLVGVDGMGAQVSSGTAEADPVRLEVFHNAFAAVAEKMGFVLMRTASSTNVKERLDFSCALFTAAGDLVVNAPHIPVHLGAMGETVRHMLAAGLRPGDVVVSNDPTRGGSHLPDVTVVTPVFGRALGLDEERLLFVVASRAHHAEIGGVAPGSMPPFSRSLAEEGVVLGAVKLVDGGVAREDEVRALLSGGPYPSRAVDDNLADLRAETAANAAGVAALAELCARHGVGVVEAYTRHIQEAAAEKMRRALRRLPRGRRTFVDHLDDGAVIPVAVENEGERAVIDFTGTSPVLPGNLNANRAIVTAAVLYSFRCLIGEDVPLNAGVLAPLSIVVPEGSLLAPPPADDPAHAAAVVGGNVETSQRLVDVILGALGAAAASQGTMNNVSFGDAGFGYYETVCGGAGATEGADGADAVHTHMTNTRLTDPEVLERRYPVRVRGFSVRRGSGGRGRWRGGDGAVRELEFLRPLTLSLLTERRGPYAPFGIAGGEAGALGENLLVRGGAIEILPAKVQVEVAAGDRLILRTPGGGGYGAP